MIRLVRIVVRHKPGEPGSIQLAVATVEQLQELTRILETSEHVTAYSVYCSQCGNCTPDTFGWTHTRLPKWRAV